MIFLLDTNACIQLWQRKHPNLLKNITRFNPTDIALCSVVKAELLFGAQRSEKKENNLKIFQRLFSSLQSFDFDDNAAENYAQIRADLTTTGNLIGPNDLMIAAIARANNLTLITHNTSAFSRVQGLQIEDWEE